MADRPVRVQGDLFDAERRKTPEMILAEAMARFPREVFACFSGGDDSLTAAHWIMNHVPGAKCFHANTGIGIERTRQFVRDTCAYHGWELVEIRAKEDCGQDYDEFVKRYGFPGPAMHHRMYARLKGRCVEKLVRDHKLARKDKILLATGIRYDESLRRMGYAERTVNFVGAQMWVNPIYWWDKDECLRYLKRHGLRRNPVSETLGMSGECLCGAYAHAGEKALVRIVCAETADRLDRLEDQVRAAGHSWGWEEAPPPQQKLTPEPAPLLEMMRMCRGCEKGVTLEMQTVSR